jgi:predicted anti-sigma-YlaC factor YlaD
MRCSKAHRLIGEELEGTIGAADRVELRKHLEACADCRELMKDFTEIADAARRLPKPVPSHRGPHPLRD